MTEYKIERDVPIPPLRTWRYPFPSMAVGDSFFAPNKTSSHMSAYCRRASVKFGHKYTMRAEEQAGQKGIRVWREE
jgi:hypothetical protein